MEPNGLQETISNYGEELPQEEVKTSKAALRRAGAAIRASKGFVLLPAEQLPGGGLRLQAKVTDVFGFVDHPRVELDPSGEKVSGVFCDCPTFRLSGGFCAHCAALLEDLAKISRKNTAWEDDSDDEEDWEEDECDDEDDQPEEEPEEPVAPGRQDPQVMDLSYKYCNSRYDLYPLQKAPQIPVERFTLMYGNNARALQLHKSQGSWGGNCFGFTSTAAILYRKELKPTLADFNPNAKIPSELSVKDQWEKLGLSVLGFIEAMQITQSGNGMWYDLSIDELAAAVEAFQKGEGLPVSMGIQKGARGGHSIFPFRLERTPEKEDILHIYDPNNPLKTQYAYLQKNEAGSYVHWRYPVTYSKPYDSRHGAILDHSPYERFADVWQKRGCPYHRNILRLQEGTSLLNAAGEVVARITQEGVELFDQEIKWIRVKTGDTMDRVALDVPMGAFQVVAEDPALEELCVELIGTDLVVDVSAEAKRVAVLVDDQQKRAYAQVPEENARYMLRFLSTLDETPEETVLTGIAQAEPVCLMLDYGQLYGSGICEAALYVDQVSKDPAAIKPLTQDEKVPEPQKIRNEAAQDNEVPEDDQI